MFTLQSPNIVGWQQQAGMAQAVMQSMMPFGNCAQALQHRGPVTIDAPLPSFNYATQPGNTPPGVPIYAGPGTGAALTVNGGGEGGSASVFFGGEANIQNLTTNLKLNVNSQVNFNINNQQQKFTWEHLTVMTDWRYYIPTHTFQIKTRDVLVPVMQGQKQAPETDWMNAPESNQPVRMPQVQLDTNWSSPNLTKNTQADVYVLENGGITNNTVIDTAVSC